MKIAVLDVSKNRIGIAISDELGKFCAFSILLYRIDKNFVNKLKKIYEKYQPLKTFVGLAIDMKGEQNEQSNFIKVFAHSFRHIIGPFEFLDERFSTRCAECIIDENVRISTDEMAAIILLNVVLNESVKTI